MIACTLDHAVRFDSFLIGLIAQHAGAMNVFDLQDVCSVGQRGTACWTTTPVNALLQSVLKLTASLLLLFSLVIVDLHAATPEVIAPTPQVAAAATPVPPPAAAAKRSAAELEKLAMPIALHPDPLISIILPAAVYPVEIVLAARFVQDTNNVSKVDAQPWEENVKAVAKFPELVAKMNADLDWTVALGQAFLDQRKELMDTIQALRLKAQQAGTLKTSPQQVVTVTNAIVEKVIEQQTVVVTNTIVQIQPSNTEVIYVPSYPPTVYYPPAYPYYYGYGYDPYAPVVSFSAGFLWGAAISHHWNHCDWHGGDVNIDIDRNTNIDRGDRTNIRGGDRVNQLDRAGNRGTQQRWQPDQSRLQRSGAPTAKTRESRGWNNTSGAGGARPGQQPSFGGGGARPSQQPAFSGPRGPDTRPQSQPSRSPGGTQRPAASQRPSSIQSPSGSQRPSSVQRSSSPSSMQRSSAFGGVSSGASARSYSNRGSYSRGGGGFSGGGGRGGGGRR